MREVIFRGKAIDTGEWVEGYYLKVEDFETGEQQPVIIPFGASILSHGDISHIEFVDPDTIGEWTGYFDCNGKKIFEGDIVARDTMIQGRVNLVVWNIQHVDFIITNRNGQLYEVVGDIYGNGEDIEVYR